MSKIIITEEERNHIVKLHKLVNESIFDSIINKLKNTSLYQKVERAYDPDPVTFVKNILPQFPKLEKLKDKLLGQITQISKMSDEQKQQFVKQHSNEINQAPQLNEQFLEGAFLLLVLVAVIYITVGISKSDSPQVRKEKEQQKQEQERQNKEQEALKYKEQNDLLSQTFNGKTINLYNDSTQQTLNSDYSPFKIISARFVQVNSSTKGVVLQGTNPETTKGLFGGRLVTSCKQNPDEFASVMSIYDNLGNDSKVFYNKAFTDKLNQIGAQWCIKPKADFGSIRSKTDTSNMV